VSVQPSSLIFLVIIGIWAAYFVQYWVRRREHLATIRSVDAFSETMRVLQRRSPLPSVDTGSQAPRTYAVSPARAMRPQVTVKRAEAHALLRNEVPTSVSTPAQGPASSRHVALPTREVEPEVATMRPSRATRGIVLLVGLVGTAVFGLLAAFGVLVLWAPLVPIVMAVAGFAWLRAGVQAEIRASHAARQESQRRVRRAAPRAEGRTAEPVRPAAPAVEHSTEVAQDTDPEASADAAPEVAEEVPFDVAEQAPAPQPADAEQGVAETVSEQPVAEVEIGLPEVDEDDIPLTWDPRPVPRPTYTMKARAPERPAAPPQAEPADEAEQPAYDELPQRRISGL
jgi:cytoskeletal protein RodZ